jgi:hypothetical protein
MRHIRRHLRCHSERSDESRIKFGPIHQGKIDRDVSLSLNMTAPFITCGLSFAARLPSKISESIFHELDNHGSGQACSDF